MCSGRRSRRCRITCQLYFQELYDFELAFIKWRLTRLHSSAALQKRVFTRFASRVLHQKYKEDFLHFFLLRFLHLPLVSLPFFACLSDFIIFAFCLPSFSIFAFSPFLFFRSCGSRPFASVSYFIFSGGFLSVTFRLRSRTCGVLIASTIALLAVCLFLLFASPCRTLSIVPVSAFWSFLLL